MNDNALTNRARVYKKRNLQCLHNLQIARSLSTERNLQFAHAFALPAGSAKIRQSAKRLLRTSFSRFFSKFVKCAPLAKTHQAEEVSGGLLGHNF